MNRDKRGGTVVARGRRKGARKGRRRETTSGGNGQMFSSSPTSTDPLLFNAGTLRMSTGRLKDAARRGGW